MDRHSLEGRGSLYGEFPVVDTFRKKVEGSISLNETRSSSQVDCEVEDRDRGVVDPRAPRPP